MEIKSFKIDKKDPYRSILTDTLNNDSPISYSNDGFYIQLTRKNENSKSNHLPITTKLLEKLIESKKWSTPYAYNIYKNQEERRELHLAHPKDQIRFSELLNNHSSVILEWTSRSPATIRWPSGLSNTFYLLPEDFSNKYKGEDIDLESNKNKRKYASKFFVYSGFNRLYKFYSSKLFLNNEERYPFFASLDVSNCFPNIYTHSIAWATKGKEYSKTLAANNAFSSISDDLDKAFQISNNGETNGILVGSEVSRIFSEIILQDVDRMIISSLKEDHNLEYNHDYVFYRYVDDYSLFFKNESDINLTKNVIRSKLSKYNLFINDNKTKIYKRPFFTSKDKLISDVEAINRRTWPRILGKEGEKRKRFYPLKIKSIKSFEVHYIKSIKNACYSSGLGYPDISGFVGAKLLRTTIRIMDDKVQNIDDERAQDYHLFFTLVINLAFFFYAVSPTTQSSLRIAKLIYKLENFYSENLKKYYRTFLSLVWGKAKDSLIKDKENIFNIENLNILISCKNFNWYLRKDPFFKEMLNNKIPNMDYFSIVNMLAIIENDTLFKEENRKISELALKKIWANPLEQCSETSHLFFDLVCCPYVDNDIKEKAIKHQCNLLLGGQYSENVRAELEDLLKTNWFIDWNNLSIERSLQRKELNSIY